MRILHLLPASPFGGLQRLALSLAAAQQRAGLDPELVTIYRDEHLVAAAQATALPCRATAGPPVCFAAVRQLAAWFRAADHDIVHVHGHVLWSLVLSRTLLAGPKIVHLHTYPPAGRALKYRMADHLLRADAARFIGVSRPVAEAWVRRGIPAGKVAVVYNGIEVPQGIDVPSSEASRFGMATRLDISKGVLEFCRACAAVGNRMPDAEFVLAGEGPAESQVEQAAIGLGIRQRLRLAGFVQDVMAFWRDEIDVALFTSPSESFGLGLLEPVLAGKPVVAFRNGTGSDEVCDRCRGIVSVPWGDWEGFTEAAVRLATDEEERLRRVAAGIEDIRNHFSLQKMEENVRLVYSQALE